MKKISGRPSTYFTPTEAYQIAIAYEKQDWMKDTEDDEYRELTFKYSQRC